MACLVSSNPALPSSLAAVVPREPGLYGWWGHTGEIPGYNTTLYHNYEDETTIIVIVNSDILLTSGVAPAPATQAALQTALGLN